MSHTVGSKIPDLRNGIFRCWSLKLKCEFLFVQKRPPTQDNQTEEASSIFDVFRYNEDHFISFVKSPESS